MTDEPGVQRGHETEVTVVGFGVLVILLIAGNELFFHNWWAFLVWFAVFAVGVARAWHVHGKKQE